MDAKESDPAKRGVTDFIPGKNVRNYESVEIDDDYFFDKSTFLMPKFYEAYSDIILMPYNMALDRIEKMAMDIQQTYQNEDEIILLCVMKGACFFYSELSEQILKIQQHSNQKKPRVTEQYVWVSSYLNDQSTGEVRIMGGENLSDIKGKCVTVCEDIVDTGATLTRLAEYLQKYSPKSISIASLLERKQDNKFGFRCDFVGFSIPDRFVVGMNFDYNNWGRNVPHLFVLNDEGKKRFAEVK